MVERDFMDMEWISTNLRVASINAYFPAGRFIVLLGSKNDKLLLIWERMGCMNMNAVRDCTNRCELRSWPRVERISGRMVALVQVPKSPELNCGVLTAYPLRFATAHVHREAANCGLICIGH